MSPNNLSRVFTASSNGITWVYDSFFLAISISSFVQEISIVSSANTNTNSKVIGSFFIIVFLIVRINVIVLYKIKYFYSDMQILNYLHNIIKNKYIDY